MFSQHGEEKALVERFNGKRGGYFVEIGALDGVMYSNTCYLERHLGWKGLLVEADPVEAEECRKNRPSSTTVGVAVTCPDLAGRPLTMSVVEGENSLSTLNMSDITATLVRRINNEGRSVTVTTRQVATTTLNDVLSQSSVPDLFDFMSIDIEGHEWPALQGFSLGSRWKPTVLLIESRGRMPDPRIVLYLGCRGYGFRRAIGIINLWFEEGQVGTGIGRLYAFVAWMTIRPAVRSVLKATCLLGFAVRLRGLHSGFRPDQ